MDNYLAQAAQAGGFAYSPHPVHQPAAFPDQAGSLDAAAMADAFAEITSWDS